MGQALVILLCFAPTVWEIIDDARGETRKDKIRDAVIAAGLYSVIALALWWILETHPLKSLALMIAIRVMFFDYVIAYVLIRRGVIKGSWFRYVGKTARWDRALSKVNPWTKLALRIVIFAGSVTYFLL